MNKKGLFGLLGLLAVVVLVITTFARKEPTAGTDVVAPVPSDATSATDTPNGDESVTLTDEERADDKATYLANIDAKMAELRMTLDSYRSRATDDSVAPALSELDTQLTKLASSVEQARSATGTEWETAKLQLDQKYTEVVQRFNDVISQEPNPAAPAGTESSELPPAPDAQTPPSAEVPAADVSATDEPAPSSTPTSAGQ